MPQRQLFNWLRKVTCYFELPVLSQSGCEFLLDHVHLAGPQPEKHRGTWQQPSLKWLAAQPNEAGAFLSQVERVAVGRGTLVNSLLNLNSGEARVSPSDCASGVRNSLRHVRALATRTHAILNA